MKPGVEHEAGARNEAGEQGDHLGVDVEQRQGVESPLPRTQPVVIGDRPRVVKKPVHRQWDQLGRPGGARRGQQCPAAIVARRTAHAGGQLARYPWCPVDDQLPGPSGIEGPWRALHPGHPLGRACLGVADDEARPDSSHQWTEAFGRRVRIEGGRPPAAGHGAEVQDAEVEGIGHRKPNGHPGRHAHLAHQRRPARDLLGELAESDVAGAAGELEEVPRPVARRAPTDQLGERVLDVRRVKCSRRPQHGSYRGMWRPPAGLDGHVSTSSGDRRSA